MEAGFAGPDQRRIFVLLRGNPRHRSRCIAVVPPFAEEMNKSRRLVTEFARLAVEAHWNVLTVDLYGTGDSAGEFRNARWQDWIGDLDQAAAWAESRGCRIDAVLGIRLGAALAMQWLRARQRRARHIVLWQPVTSGSMALDQFLRLRVAASMMEGGIREGALELRARLAEGELLEIAGYELTGPLASDLDTVGLGDDLATVAGPVHWIDVPRSSDTPPSASTRRLLDEARARGSDVRFLRCAAEPFWTSTEIVCPFELAEETVRILRDPES